MSSTALRFIISRLPWEVNAWILNAGFYNSVRVSGIKQIFLKNHDNLKIVINKPQSKVFLMPSWPLSCHMDFTSKAEALMPNHSTAMDAMN